MLVRQLQQSSKLKLLQENKSLNDNCCTQQLHKLVVFVLKKYIPG